MSATAAAPLILAVDTTLTHGSIALARGDETLEEVSIEAPDGFAQVVYEHLQGLFERHNLKPDDVDCFAAAAGPGSFTGVRVGLVCIKGLAEACGKQAVGISNLEALAGFGSAPLRAPLMDARRGEIYGAVYDARGAMVMPEIVSPLSAWLASLPGADVDLVSTDFAPFKDQLAGTRWEQARLVTAPRALAGMIAKIAFYRFTSGQAQDPAALDANYVRRSDAELLLKV